MSVKAFKDPVTKLCAMFAQSVILIFDSFNTFLQSEEPLVHVLYESTTCYNKFLKEVRFFYMKCASYLESSMPILKDSVIKSFNFPQIARKT